MLLLLSYVKKEFYLILCIHVFFKVGGHYLQNILISMGFLMGMLQLDAN